MNIQVNESWACDEGRLNYHLINDNRLTIPQVNKGGGQKEVSWQEALKAAGQIMAEAGEGLSVIVPASLSLEDGKALLSLLESLGIKAMLNDREARVGRQSPAPERHEREHQGPHGSWDNGNS